MIVIYGIIALFIVWLWVAYFRSIDIYDKGKLKYFILTFFLGCIAVLLVLGLDKYLLSQLNFNLNGRDKIFRK